MDNKFAGASQTTNASPDVDDSDAETRRSSGPEDRQLSAAAETWLSTLPEGVRPVQLSQSFPRICNGLAERWPEPEFVLPMLDELLVDNRGDRQGFSLQIVMEITNLKKYFQQTYAPEDPDLWDRTPGLY